MNTRRTLSRIAWFAAALALAATLTTPILAAEPQDAAHGEAHADDAAGHGASEPPDILAGDLGNVFWTLLIFFTLLFVLRMTAWKPILRALDNREKFITDSLESAKREREEAERVLKEYTRKVEKAREEATAIVEEGRRDAEDVRKRIHTEAKQEADAMIDRAKKEIGLARDHAVKELYDQTVVLATAVAGKIVRKELGAGDHRALIDESLAEIGRLNG